MEEMVSRPPYYGWFDLERFWDSLFARKLALDKLSDRAENTRRWNPHFNLVGPAGEQLTEILTGMPMNREIKIRDGGVDFPGLQVKAVAYEYNRDPHLKVEDLTAPFYFLCVVDEARRLARPCGYATRAMLKNAPLRSYGKRGSSPHSLPETELVSADRILGIMLQRTFG